MVDEYNQAARQQHLSQEQMRAVRGNLLEPSSEDAAQLEQPDYFGFHVIVVCMALHHVGEPSELVRKLAERLDSDGSLVIVDVVAPSESHIERPQPAPDAGSAKAVASHGFTRQDMLAMFADAGLVDADVRWYPRPSIVPPQMGGKLQLFFARAKRPKASST
jgi:hypothetical protein